VLLEGVASRLAQCPDQRGVTSVPSQGHGCSPGPSSFLVGRAGLVIKRLPPEALVGLNGLSGEVPRRPLAKAREPASEGAIMENSLSSLLIF